MLSGPAAFSLPTFRMALLIPVSGTKELQGVFNCYLCLVDQSSLELSILLLNLGGRLTLFVIGYLLWFMIFPC